MDMAICKVILMLEMAICVGTVGTLWFEEMTMCNSKLLLDIAECDFINDGRATQFISFLTIEHF